jgi:hypothetical protein
MAEAPISQMAAAHSSTPIKRPRARYLALSRSQFIVVVCYWGRARAGGPDHYSCYAALTVTLTASGILQRSVCELLRAPATSCDLLRDAAASNRQLLLPAAELRVAVVVSRIRPVRLWSSGHGVREASSALYPSDLARQPSVSKIRASPSRNHFRQ